MKYANSKKSHGVSFKPWADRVKELLDESGLELPKKHEMTSMYLADFSYEDVVLKLQFVRLKKVHMELHVTHEHGEYVTSFMNDLQAKEFFGKFPELRKELTIEPEKMSERRNPWRKP